MRPTSDSHTASRRLPKKLAAMAPVASRIASVSTAPSPGRWKPSRASLRNRAGTMRSDWSMSSTSSASTQNVIASGIQTSRPAMR